MKLDDESETKGVSSLLCLIIAFASILLWTYGVHSGMLTSIIDWLKEL